MDTDQYLTQVFERTYSTLGVFENTPLPHILTTRDSLNSVTACAFNPGTTFPRMHRGPTAYLEGVKWSDQSRRISGKWRSLHSSPTAGDPGEAGLPLPSATADSRPGHHFKSRQTREKARDFTSRQAVRPKGRNSISQQAPGGGRRGALCGM